MSVFYWIPLLLVLLSTPATITAITHGHDHIRIPSVNYIKQQLIKQGSMMRGDELAEHAQEKYDELLDHIHSTHAHESKYGQINSIKSPLPRPKPPIPCTFKKKKKISIILDSWHNSLSFLFSSSSFFLN